MDSTTVQPSFKAKVEIVLTQVSFCGICFDDKNLLISIDTVVEILSNSDSKKLTDIINYVFQDNVAHLVASDLICEACMQKLLQSFSFIQDTRESSKLINYYIENLKYQTDDINIEIDTSDNLQEKPSIVIILPEYSNESIFPEISKQNKKTKQRKVKNSRKSNKSRQCKICNKVCKFHSLLLRHYKIVHGRVKCKICRILVPDGDLTEHLKVNHDDVIHTCEYCESAFYSVDALGIHKKITHLLKYECSDEESECKMCLKRISSDEIKFHKCKYSCPNCTENPCIHYKYLVAYREQILNYSNKIKCLDCNYICRKRDSLIGHVNREHLKFHPFTCNDCGTQFYSKMLLKSHVLRFHLEYHSCPYCDKKFQHKSHLNNHTEICKEIIRCFKCDECLASFDNEEELSKHQKYKHSLNYLSCYMCKRICLNEGQLNEHVTKVHKGIQIVSDRSDLICKLCNMKFDTRGERIQHLKTHDPDSKFPCKICNIEFENLRKLELHNRKHKTKCHVCNKNIPKDNFDYHMRNHEGENVIVDGYACEVCGKSFQSERKLMSHQKVHLGPIACPICQKNVKHSWYKRHIKKHNSKGQLKLQKDPHKKKYKGAMLKCSWCDYVAYHKQMFEVHINRFHLKVKPYICEICNKDFCGSSQLRTHRLTHEAAKSLACEICSKKFANNICLKLHLRIHSGEKKYSCSECDESFRTSSILFRHKVTKHVGKNIDCPLCESKFHMLVDLRRHFKKVHWKDKGRKFDPRQVEGLNEEHYHLFEDHRRPKLHEDDWEFL